MISIKKNPQALFFVAAVFILMSASSAFAQEQDHVEGALLVMMKKGTDPGGLLNRFSVLDGKRTDLKVAQNLSERLNVYEFHFNHLLIDENKMLDALQQHPDVLIVQFNHYLELRNTPDDPNFSQQWNMYNIGQTSGTEGADIRAVDAWDLATGGLTASGDTIVIAVIDDGFDLLHEDVSYWKNYAEIPANGMDDDGNGYVDDFSGWNALDHTGNIPIASHGTHVSGIAGAKGNNATGVAGVNWNVQIMPVKGYSGVESIVVEGYAYVLEMRARFNESGGTEGALVVSANSSFGINNGQPTNYPLWCAMYDSMGQYGILHATATANSNVNVDLVGDMPTACPSEYMISVTNTTATDQKNSSAGYGAVTIDLGAPGTSILSTLTLNTYGTKTGTSSASPHIAGAVALLYSLQCEKLAFDYLSDPAGTALRMKDFLLGGVDSLGDLTNSFPTVTGGRLNVYNAMELAGAYYNCNVGIEEVLAGEEEFVLYPNPAVDELTVVMNKNFLSPITVTVINLLGQRQAVHEYSVAGNEIRLNISSLLPGPYWLMVQGNEEVLTGSFIRQ
jgi:hypothetical protein